MSKGQTYLEEHQIEGPSSSRDGRKWPAKVNRILKGYRLSYLVQRAQNILDVLDEVYLGE